MPWQATNEVLDDIASSVLIRSTLRHSQDQRMTAQVDFLLNCGCLQTSSNCEYDTPFALRYL